MSTETVLVLMGFVVTVGVSIIYPNYVSRRAERRADEKAAKEEAEKVAAGTEVNWEKINGAIVRERDRKAVELEQQTARYELALTKMREQHGQEIAQIRRQWAQDVDRLRSQMDQEAADLKARYDEEISELRSTLVKCQTKVQELYGELYELQRRFPPEAGRPTEVPR